MYEYTYFLNLTICVCFNVKFINIALLEIQTSFDGKFGFNIDVHNYRNSKSNLPIPKSKVHPLSSWVASLQWRHNGRDGISNHQPHDYLLNRLFRRGSKKTTKSASLAFVRRIHRWPVNFPHKGPVMRCFDISFAVRLNKLLHTQLTYWWFQTLHSYMTPLIMYLCNLCLIYGERTCL